MSEKSQAAPADQQFARSTTIRVPTAVVSIVIGALTAVAGQTVGSKVEPVVLAAQELFPQGAVRLLDGPFKTNQDIDLAYLMRFEPDRLLSQFRVEAGLEPKAKAYGGWETPAAEGKTWSLAGHTLGHYLSAISLMYRLTDDQRLRERVEYMVDELKECQDKRGDGSLVAFPYVKELEAAIKAGDTELIRTYWAPFYTIHKELAGLKDAWVLCGDETAREVMVGLADWCGQLVKDLTDEQREKFLDREHGGMPEVLADVYAITGEKRFLEYARMYSHHHVLDPLAKGNDTLTGMHANTQVPKFTGFERIYELAGDAEYGAAARNFWKTVVGERTWANGGNSIHEHFPKPENMGEQIPHDGGPETCNTYNMLRLTAALHRVKPDAEYLEYYEGALFNHILGSQAPMMGAGAFVYYTPLRPGYARSYGTDFHSFWCCTGTGMENHARYGELIYTHDAQSLWVNLFMASELDWAERGLSLRQETRFPKEPGTALVITAAPDEALTIHLRHPSWLAESMVVAVNGRRVELAPAVNGFVELKRVWKPGDRIDVGLPMELRVVRGKHTADWISIFYGPILLSGELGDDGLKRADFIGRYTPINAMIPMSRAPLIVTAGDEDILKRISPVPGRPGVFRTEGLVKPEDVILSPFYDLHFQRYAIYWQTSDEAGWEKRKEVLAAAEKKERELDARTVDHVRLGEQQPEIDHDMRFERSSSNIGREGRRWRAGKDGGWFSYRMKVPADGGKAAVRLEFWGHDNGPVFDLLIDDEVIASPQAKRKGVEGYYGVEYPIPDEALKAGEAVTVRIQGREGKGTGSIYGLRVVARE